ncbi:MAG: hypothetical protein RXR18_06245 [Nitrososphaeria archaeon]
MSEQVRQVGPKDYLIGEDQIVLRTILHSDVPPSEIPKATVIFLLGAEEYFTFVADINGKRIRGDKYDYTEVFDDFDKIVDTLLKRAKALRVVKSPATAEGLANEMIEDIISLFALTRAMLLKAKTRLSEES